MNTFHCFMFVFLVILAVTIHVPSSSASLPTKSNTAATFYALENLFESVATLNYIDAAYILAKDGVLCQHIPYTYKSISYASLQSIVGTVRSRDNGEVVAVWSERKQCYVNIDQQDFGCSNYTYGGFRQCESDPRLMININSRPFRELNSLLQKREMLESVSLKRDKLITVVDHFVGVRMQQQQQAQQRQQRIMTDSSYSMEILSDDDDDATDGSNNDSIESSILLNHDLLADNLELIARQIGSAHVTSDITAALNNLIANYSTISATDKQNTTVTSSAIQYIKTWFDSYSSTANSSSAVTSSFMRIQSNFNNFTAESRSRILLLPSLNCSDTWLLTTVANRELELGERFLFHHILAIILNTYAFESNIIASKYSAIASTPAATSAALIAQLDAAIEYVYGNASRMVSDLIDSYLNNVTSAFTNVTGNGRLAINNSSCYQQSFQQVRQLKEQFFSNSSGPLPAKLDGINKCWRIYETTRFEVMQVNFDTPKTTSTVIVSKFGVTISIETMTLPTLGTITTTTNALHASPPVEIGREFSGLQYDLQNTFFNSFRPNPKFPSGNVVLDLLVAVTVNLPAQTVEAITTSPGDVRIMPAPTTTPNYPVVFPCEPGFYGPTCKTCPPGTWSPGDGLLHLCSNAPTSNNPDRPIAVYTDSMVTNPDCPFKCLSGMIRNGSACVYPPNGYYPVDGSEQIGKCKPQYNVHAGLISFTSPGGTGGKTSCSYYFKFLLADSNATAVLSSLSPSSSFTFQMWAQLSKTELFDIISKSNISVGDSVGLGLMTMPNRWSWYLLAQRTTNSTSPTVWAQMQFKLHDGNDDPPLTSKSFRIDDDQAWHHYAVVYDHEKRLLAFLRDGLPMGTAWFGGLSTMGPVTNPNTPEDISTLAIGGHYYTLAMPAYPPSVFNYLPAYIDHVQIHNTSLPLEELSYVQIPTYDASNSECNDTNSDMEWFVNTCIAKCPAGAERNEINKDQCMCINGQYLINNTTCAWCPNGMGKSNYPRTSASDCSCQSKYVWSEFQKQCVVALAGFSAPTGVEAVGLTPGSIIPSGSNFSIPAEVVFNATAPDNSANAGNGPVYAAVKLWRNEMLIMDRLMNSSQFPLNLNFNSTGRYTFRITLEQDGRRPGSAYSGIYDVRRKARIPIASPTEVPARPTVLVLASPEKSYQIYYSLTPINDTGNGTTTTTNNVTMSLYDINNPPIVYEGLKLRACVRMLQPSSVIDSDILEIDYKSNTSSPGNSTGSGDSGSGGGGGGTGNSTASSSSKDLVIKEALEKAIRYGVDQCTVQNKVICGVVLSSIAFVLVAVPFLIISIIICVVKRNRKRRAALLAKSRELVERRKQLQKLEEEVTDQRPKSKKPNKRPAASERQRQQQQQRKKRVPSTREAPRRNHTPPGRDALHEKAAHKRRSIVIEADRTRKTYDALDSTPSKRTPSSATRRRPTPQQRATATTSNNNGARRRPVSRPKAPSNSNNNQVARPTTAAAARKLKKKAVSGKNKTNHSSKAAAVPADVAEDHVIITLPTLDSKEFINPELNDMAPLSPSQPPLSAMPKAPAAALDDADDDGITSMPKLPRGEQQHNNNNNNEDHHDNDGSVIAALVPPPPPPPPSATTMLLPLPAYLPPPPPPLSQKKMQFTLRTAAALPPPTPPPSNNQ